LIPFPTSDKTDLIMLTKPEATQLLRDATERFIRQCGVATDTQWNARPNPHTWSMGDVAEHVSIANRGILARLSGSLLASPIGLSPDVRDDEIPYLFYRGEEPPNIATPTGAWTSWSAAEPPFRDSATPLLAWAEDIDADLRAFGIAHPVFGLMDGIQWLLFAAAHTERHRAQLIGLRGGASR
jgi:hypothetical protein